MKRILSVIVLFAFLEASVNAGPMFTGLGDLSGGDYRSEANAISADGATIVGWSNSSQGREAFQWTFGGGLVSLGELPGGYFSSRATDISADGSVITGTSSSSFGTEAFRWTKDTGMIGLGELPGGIFSSNATSISADGSSIAGFAYSDDYIESFRWTEQTGITGLGVLPNGLSSIAHSISGDGQVIVGQATNEVTNGFENKAFRWTTETGLQPILSTKEDSSAHAVSADGSIVVGTIGHILDGTGFLWKDDGQLIDLGAFVPNAISDDGSVIVGTILSQIPPSNAIIWDPIYGARDLQSILETDFNLDLEGWSLSEATDISADGTVIVGYGVNPSGDFEAWVAVVPEPATLLLLGAGSLVWLRKR